MQHISFDPERIHIQFSLKFKNELSQEDIEYIIEEIRKGYDGPKDHLNHEEMLKSFVRKNEVFGKFEDGSFDDLMKEIEVKNL